MRLVNFVSDFSGIALSFFLFNSVLAINCWDYVHCFTMLRYVPSNPWTIQGYFYPFLSLPFCFFVFVVPSSLFLSLSFFLSFCPKCCLFPVVPYQVSSAHLNLFTSEIVGSTWVLLHADISSLWSIRLIFTYWRTRQTSATCVPGESIQALCDFWLVISLWDTPWVQVYWPCSCLSMWLLFLWGLSIILPTLL